MHAELLRMGGVLLHPRTTLRDLITRGQGSMGRLFFWLVIMVVVSEPVRVGRALLVGRQQPLDGALLFLNAVAGRLLEPLFLVILAALALFVVGRAKRARGGAGIGFDAASDVAAYFTVPLLAVTAVAAILDGLGLPVAALPLHGVRGHGAVWAARLLLAYGWPFALLVIAAGQLDQAAPDPVDSADPGRSG